MSSFTTPLTVRVLSRYRFELVEPFRYYLGSLDSGAWIEVPAGFVTDFASVPRFLWWLFPPHGRWAKSAVIHDYVYGGGLVESRHGREASAQRPSRKASDRIFYEAMLVLGVPRWKAWTMWAAVRCFGWTAWKG